MHRHINERVVKDGHWLPTNEEETDAGVSSAKPDSPSTGPSAHSMRRRRTC